MRSIPGTITAYPGPIRRRSATLSPGPSEATWTVHTAPFHHDHNPRVDGGRTCNCVWTSTGWDGSK